LFRFGDAPIISANISLVLSCSPTLDRPEQEFPGGFAQGGAAADEPFMSDIGGL
jgi:hypothetical protein